jgi:(2Fe-2S) ferredoxin
MPIFDCHLFVCCNQRDPAHPRGCCASKDSEKIREALKAELKRRGLTGTVRANEAGCLDQCEFGPTMVIYPQQIWYGGLTEADVPRIVEETVIGGRILPDLRIPDECLNTKGKTPWKRTPSPDTAPPA